MVSFTARRRKPELVIPALPTPHEYKALSDIDDQHGLRFYPAGIEFFRARRHDDDPIGGDGVDPARVIRSALAKALVSYYPLAGRLMELPAAGGKLLVDCTAQGVVFAEADADVRLEDFGQPLAQLCPCVEELLCYDDDDDTSDEPEGSVVVGKPLLFVQVTRFRDNGFSVGYRFCHSVVDGFGMAKLLDDVYRLARGEALTVMPVWERELLTARAPPCPIGHIHAAYKKIPAEAGEDDIMLTTPLDQMAVRHFHFGPREMAAMRGQVPASLLRTTTVYELVTAAVWRRRTVALGYASHQPVRLLLVSSIAAGGIWKSDALLPRGYYGNTVVPLATEATAGELCGRPLRDALELVHKAKTMEVTDDYVQSMLQLLAQRGRPFFPLNWTFAMSDTSSLSRRVAKLGRWERAGGGITTVGPVVRTSVQSYYDRCKSGGGEECVVVSMCLPAAGSYGQVRTADQFVVRGIHGDKLSSVAVPDYLLSVASLLFLVYVGQYSVPCCGYVYLKH